MDAEDPTTAPRHYLVELAARERSWGDMASVTSRARAAAGRLLLVGSAVTFVRSVYAPESDSLFLVYQATSEAAVLAATRDAELEPISVSAAIAAVDGGGPMK